MQNDFSQNETWLFGDRKIVLCGLTLSVNEMRENFLGNLVPRSISRTFLLNVIFSAREYYSVVQHGGTPSGMVQKARATLFALPPPTSSNLHPCLRYIDLSDKSRGKISPAPGMLLLIRKFWTCGYELRFGSAGIMRLWQFIQAMRTGRLGSEKPSRRNRSHTPSRTESWSV